jgi:hypothetical protein
MCSVVAYRIRTHGVMGSNPGKSPLFSYNHHFEILYIIQRITMLRKYMIHGSFYGRFASGASVDPTS